jgi:hypothetical protein
MLGRQEKAASVGGSCECGWLQQHSSLLHEIYRVLCAFREVALRAKQLDISELVFPALREWDDVIQVTIL